MPAQTIIQLRRDTAANWTSADPVLAAAELGVETDTNKVKIGDGATAWSLLAYFGSLDSLNNVGDVTITSATTGQVLQFDGTKWVNGTIDLSSKANVVNPDFNINGTLNYSFTQEVTFTGSPGSMFMTTYGQVENVGLSTGSEVYFSNTTYSGNDIDGILFTVTNSYLSSGYSELTLDTVDSADDPQVQAFINATGFNPVSGVIINQDFDKTISSIELGQLDNASSNIQVQLDTLVPSTQNPDNGYNFSQGSWLAVDPNSGLPVWQEGGIINARSVRAINGPLGAPSSLYYPLIIQGFNGDTFQPSVTTIGYGDDSSGAYIVQKWEGSNPIPIATIKSDGSLSTLGPIASTQSVIPKSSAYTLVYEDRSQFITADGTFTITIPASVFSAGDRVDFVNIGTGVVTFAEGSGFTLNSADAAVTIDSQWAAATIFFINSTSGVLIGKLA